ncbi:MAG TPA: biotin--[acetyl-CoA-carboxylase] ligase [Telluria sp.]|jgi:BirA family biotin operon repressor/biotin-[acetyl-CoA-carboxylase] ligase
MNSADITRLSHASAARQVAVEVVQETGSTNADLLARAPALAHNLLLVALQQTAGRGRAGRSWLSSEGSLTFSLAWKFRLPLHALAGLPLAVGVALAETLARLDVRVQLKWPNDLLKDGAKLAGVLIETQSAADGALWAVIGVGMNLTMPDELEQRIGRPAAGAPWLASMERAALVAALLDQLAASMQQFEQAGFAAFSARWNRLHAWQGNQVAIIDQGATLQEGTAAGVDDRGALLLDTAAGRVAIVAGDVSLRVLA